MLLRSLSCHVQDRLDHSVLIPIPTPTPISHATTSPPTNPYRMQGCTVHSDCDSCWNTVLHQSCRCRSELTFPSRAKLRAEIENLHVKLQKAKAMQSSKWPDFREFWLKSSVQPFCDSCNVTMPAEMFSNVQLKRAKQQRKALCHLCAAKKHSINNKYMCFGY